MEQSTLLIIQCVGIALIIFALFYYFNKKMGYMNMAIESLQTQVLEQNRIIDKHEHLLRQLFGIDHKSFEQKPVNYDVSRKPQNSLHQNSPHQNSPHQNPIEKLAPMVSGLFGVINSMQSVGNPEPTSPNVPDISEKQINEELKNELDELKPVTDIKEGRVDTL